MCSKSHSLGPSSEIEALEMLMLTIKAKCNKIKTLKLLSWGIMEVNMTMNYMADRTHTYLPISRTVSRSTFHPLNFIFLFAFKTVRCMECSMSLHNLLCR